jgi:hypothetical protein
MGIAKILEKRWEFGGTDRPKGILLENVGFAESPTDDRTDIDVSVLPLFAKTPQFG